MLTREAEPGILLSREKMKRIYRIPIQGTVLNDEPLTGSNQDPLITIELSELPGFDLLQNKGFSLVNLDYDIDEEWGEIELEADDALHEWLLGLIQQLRSIAQARGLVLDKTELEKVRRARQEGALDHEQESD